MRRVAEFEAERRHLLEMELRQSGFLREGGAPAGPAKANTIATSGAARKSTDRMLWRHIRISTRLTSNAADLFGLPAVAGWYASPERDPMT